MVYTNVQMIIAPSTMILQKESSPSLLPWMFNYSTKTVTQRKVKKWSKITMSIFQKTLAKIGHLLFPVRIQLAFICLHERNCVWTCQTHWRAFHQKWMDGVVFPCGALQSFSRGLSLQLGKLLTFWVITSWAAVESNSHSDLFLY